MDTFEFATLQQKNVEKLLLNNKFLNNEKIISKSVLNILYPFYIMELEKYKIVNIADDGYYDVEKISNILYDTMKECYDMCMEINKRNGYSEDEVMNYVTLSILNMMIIY